MPKAAAKEKAPAKEKAAKKEKAPAKEKKEKKAKDPNAPKKPMVSNTGCSSGGLDTVAETYVLHML
jgi:hypothetical protein